MTITQTRLDCGCSVYVEDGKRLSPAFRCDRMVGLDTELLAAIDKVDSSGGFGAANNEAEQNRVFAADRAITDHLGKERHPDG